VSLPGEDLGGGDNMNKEDKHSCGTCKWWQKTVGWEYGVCRDALERARKLVPESVFIPYDEHEMGGIRVTQIAPFAGVDCPAWEAK